MIWNWQLDNWPNFIYNASLLKKYEEAFLLNSGELSGAYQHITNHLQTQIHIDIVSDEALNSSKIEGEYLDRESVQLSLKKNFGLLPQHSKQQINSAAEQGIADLMTDVYKNFNTKLSHVELFKWHKLLMADRKKIEVIGDYRKHDDDMQIISGPYYKPKIHFIAPPSNTVAKQMDSFITWYNQNLHTLGALTIAGITHIYFLSIHPFEDGNGRIARALSEKVLYQSLDRPLLISISTIIHNNKKEYYDMLNYSNQSLDINNWLHYFAKVILAAQKHSYDIIKFTITKSKFFQLHREKLNIRQAKVINKIFAAGPQGFDGGLSAENYISITKTSRATATRDLNDLIQKNILYKTGELKSTRYYLNLDIN